MTAQELRAQADSLAAQALHGDLFSSPASEAKIQELRAQARALETEINENQKCRSELTEKRFKLSDQINELGSDAAPSLRSELEECVSEIKAKELESKPLIETFCKVYAETRPEIPPHNDDDLMTQWREANRAGDGQSFGDPDDLTCEIDIYDSAEIEGAQVLCGAGEGYLVRWMDDYYLVCDANGWWACRVTP